VTHSDAGVFLTLRAHLTPCVVNGHEKQGEFVAGTLLMITEGHSESRVTIPNLVSRPPFGPGQEKIPPALFHLLKRLLTCSYHLTEHEMRSYQLV
jgi:hypothetical protein